MKNAQLFKASFNRDNLFYEVRAKKDALKQIVRHAIRNVGRRGIVYCLSRKKVEEISKGMAQKVQFVSCVLHNPKLLILDEPFSGFDPVNADLIKDLILSSTNFCCSKEFLNVSMTTPAP